MRQYTVAQLRAALEGVSDDTPVVLCGIKDHTYIEPGLACVHEVGAKIKGTYGPLTYGDYFTWEEEDKPRDLPDNVKVKVFLIG